MRAKPNVEKPKSKTVMLKPNVEKPKSKLESLHAKYPWKTFDKFFPIAKRHGFNDKTEVMKFLQNHVIHDQKVKNDYLPIFSTIRNAYQFDTYFPKRGEKPFLLFININTRKAYAYELENKKKEEVLKALTKFNKDAHPKFLQSDQDSSYLSNAILTFLKNHDIIYTTVTDNDHHVLGIINRFIRTLRDSGKIVMEKWIKSYNKSPHKSLNAKSPNDMNEEAELEYIKRKQEKMSQKLNDRIIYPEGLKVRITSNPNKQFTKKRSKLSNQAYIIDGMVGNQYFIRAADGSIDKVPFFRIVPVAWGGKNKGGKNKIKIAKRIDNVNPKSKVNNPKLTSKRYTVDKILRYHTAEDKYEVLYDNGEKDYIPARNLREGRPLELSVMERKFWKDKQRKMPNKVAMWL
jgi:hypothetical protein